MKKVLFIDRDGTILVEPKDNFQIDSFDKFKFLPGAIFNLSQISKQLDYDLVLVTNQDGMGTSSFPEDTFWPYQNKMIQILEDEGVFFKDIFIDTSFDYENKPTRKPGVAMLNKYLFGNYDLENSYVIGDRQTDVELAKNIGCKSIYIGSSPIINADLSANSWIEINDFLKKGSRISRYNRKTNETSISVFLNIDGQGKSFIHTGLGFFDHMLEQISKHGAIDMNINVEGDLNVDEHHTIEDTAIALGIAFDKALGNKRGINRYGFLLPMDDCLAQVAIDFGGRPWLVWDAKFLRERIGEMPSEMFYHFFKSFSDAAKCNINIKAEGENEHHKIEAIFKAFAKAIRMAVKQNDSFDIPTTKGVL